LKQFDFGNIIALPFYKEIKEINMVKLVMVTGATSGIGKATATIFC
jgi:hypothetical protein